MNNPFNTNENILSHFTFRINIYLFWIKANYWLINKNLVGKTPATFAFNSIPMGTTKITQPRLWAEPNGTTSGLWPGSPASRTGILP